VGVLLHECRSEQREHDTHLGGDAHLREGARMAPRATDCRCCDGEVELVIQEARDRSAGAEIDCRTCRWVERGWGCLDVFFRLACGCVHAMCAHVSCTLM
jgi:hypothetical protein